MKKQSAVIAVLLIATAVSAYAQFSVGVYGTGCKTLGDYAEYITAEAGGGITGEYTLPFTFPLFSTPVRTGVSVHADCDAGIKDSRTIDSITAVSALGGIWLKIPFTTEFSFQPEISYGCLFHIVKYSASSYNQTRTYADQIIQLAPSFRYAPAALLGGKMEFELSPLYTFSPEKDHVLQNLGGRISVLYTIR